MAWLCAEACDICAAQAWKGDTEGNLVFHAAARNFNPDMAKAAKVGGDGAARFICVICTISPDNLTPPRVAPPGCGGGGAAPGADRSADPG